MINFAALNNSAVSSLDNGGVRDPMTFASNFLPEQLAINQAANSYKSTLRAIKRIVETVESFILRPANWSDQMSRGLKEQLDIAQLKLENELQVRYDQLCNSDPQRMTDYTVDFDNQTDI